MCGRCRRLADVRVGASVKVKGYSDLIRTLNYLGGDIKKEVKAEIRKAGEGTKRDAMLRAAAAGWSAKTVSGYRVVVRMRGVAVEQSRRRTTGKHRKFGGVQMRKALIPARNANFAQALRDMENAVQAIVKRAGR